MKRPFTPKSEPAAENSFPMRLNKYLAQQGYATRRDADKLIEKGSVFVNGARALVGDKVSETDTVEVRNVGRAREHVYLAFNKPRGMDTHREATGSPNVLDALSGDLKRLGLFPIGRLDKDSRGLLILTNDGRITDRLLNPKYAHQKVYEVRTKQPLRANTKEKLEQGVNIEGYMTKPAKVEVLGADRFRIALTEGKTHQVRRMVVALFNEVKDLRRVSIMGIRLGTLKEGGYRLIEGAERDKFLRDLGLLQKTEA
jgi:23S rRNA pseudouridine2604 synthase